jgi:hypothetical protein
LLFAALGAACSTETAVSARDSGSNADGHTQTTGLLPSQLPPDFHCDPTLESLRDTIFTKTCAWDTCHSNNAPPFGLSLITDVQTIHDSLVGVPAGGCKGAVRVSPGDPDGSYFWNKLVASHPTCGDPMPRGVEPLPDAALACIKTWISQL